jgi:hypothetical protein
VDDVAVRLEHVDLLNGRDGLDVHLLEGGLELLVVTTAGSVDLLDLSSGSTLSAVFRSYISLGARISSGISKDAELTLRRGLAGHSCHRLARVHTDAHGILKTLELCLIHSCGRVSGGRATCQERAERAATCETHVRRDREWDWWYSAIGLSLLSLSCLNRCSASRLARAPLQYSSVWASRLTDTSVHQHHNSETTALLYIQLQFCALAICSLLCLYQSAL